MDESRLGLIQLALPTPCIAQGITEASFGLPTQQGFGFTYIGPNLHNVACAAFTDFVRHRHAIHFFKGANDFEHGISFALPQVDGLAAAGLVEQIIQCFDMGLGQVHDMDKVADAGAVWCWIIRSKDGECFAVPRCGLGQKWNEIIAGSYNHLTVHTYLTL